MGEKWTKTSALPSDGAMNPNPLSALNHLTVPCAILAFLPGGAPPPTRRRRAAAVLPGRKRCLPRGHLAQTSTATEIEAIADCGSSNVLAGNPRKVATRVALPHRPSRLYEQRPRRPIREYVRRRGCHECARCGSQ